MRTAIDLDLPVLRDHGNWTKTPQGKPSRLMEIEAKQYDKEGSFLVLKTSEKAGAQNGPPK